MGLLHRLEVESVRILRIGKEIDRLAGDDGASLGPDLPIDYACDDLAEDLDYLASFPRAQAAADLSLTERGWRKILTARREPRKQTIDRIRDLALRYKTRDR